MRIAITGSSGLIGSALRASLEADGHQPVPVVRAAGRPGKSYVLTAGAKDSLTLESRTASVGSSISQ